MIPEEKMYVVSFCCPDRTVKEVKEAANVINVPSALFLSRLVDYGLYAYHMGYYPFDDLNEFCEFELERLAAASDVLLEDMISDPIIKEINDV